MMRLARKGDKSDLRCAYNHCPLKVTEDDWCFGCNFYVCEVHSFNIEADGFGHDVIEHWTEDSDD